MQVLVLFKETNKKTVPEIRTRSGTNHKQLFNSKSFNRLAFLRLNRQEIASF
jgi:hypothetical protein